MSHHFPHLSDGLAIPVNGPAEPRTFRHLKRGTTYTEVGTAWLQSEEPIREGVPLMIYQGEDGKLWARPFNEFMDGRFKQIPTPPEPECDLEYLPSSEAGRKPGLSELERSTYLDENGEPKMDRSSGHRRGKY